MQSLNTLFKDYELEVSNSKLNNERQTWLKPIVDEITKEREKCKWRYEVNGKWHSYSKDVAKSVALKTSHLLLSGDFIFIHKRCIEYKKRRGSYSKGFFGMLSTGK